MTVTEAAVLPATGKWKIDSAHSTVVFGVRHHAVAKFRSGFTGIVGCYDAGSGKLEGEVRVDSIVLTNPALERLKGHLLTKDFFNAEEFSTTSFESTSVRSDGETLVVEGNLTLRGVTGPVSGTGLVTAGPRVVTTGNGTVGERFGIEIKTVVDRREFGVDFNNEIAEGVPNLGWDTEIEISLELIREQD